MSLVPVPKNAADQMDTSDNVDRNSKEYKEAFNKFILNNLENHPAKLLKEYLEQIDQIITYNPEKVTELREYIRKTEDLIENFDNAKIFIDIGGFNYIPKLLQVKDENIKEATCDFIAELVQNHQVCQDEAQKINILPDIISIFDHDNYDNVKVKAIYALSRNKNLQTQFLNNGGIDILLKGLQSPVEKIKLKTTLLVMYMSLENEDFTKQFHQKGILFQLLKNVMTYEHDLSHEHTLNAILSMVKTDPSLVTDLKHSCKDLKTFLLERGAILDGKPEYIEEDTYVKTLYELCFEEDLSEAIGALNIPKI
ncbi:unnamed protein product [Gordionus sp. m RMFG-2023]